MILALALASVLGQGYFTPDEAQALFAQANEAYYREDYAAAEAGYQKLLQRGFAGPDVLYNLGTSYLAEGKLGEATLFLERARVAGGRSEDLDANLALARSKQLDQVVGGQASDSFLRRVTLATSESAVTWIFLVAWAAAFLALVLRRLTAQGRRSLATFVAIAGFVVAVPAGALFAAHVYVRETVEEAVVLSSTLAARELPKETAKISFEVHAGLKVRLLESAGRFVKIRLPNGLEGWAEREGVADI